eukprot:14933649-Alexandrium_andersonii.AAC.1
MSLCGDRARVAVLVCWGRCGRPVPFRARTRLWPLAACAFGLGVRAARLVALPVGRLRRAWWAPPWLGARFARGGGLGLGLLCLVGRTWASWPWLSCVAVDRRLRCPAVRGL